MDNIVSISALVDNAGADLVYIVSFSVLVHKFVFAI